MKIKLLSVLSTLLIPSFLLAGMSVKKEAQYISEVNQAITDMLDAGKAKDIETLESFHAYGPKFTKFDDWEPLTRHDAASAKQAEATGFEALSSFDYKLNDLKIDIISKRVAVATFHVDYEMGMGDQVAKAKARGTMVWKKTKNGWKVFHEHFSAFKANP